MPLGPLVVIEWVDSSAISRKGVWHTDEDVSGQVPALIRSVGWIVREDKKAVVLAAHDGGDFLGGDLCIPKVSVTKRTRMHDRGRKTAPR